MTLRGHYAVRDELTARLTQDLMGPGGGPQETIADPPITRYLCGVLFPQSPDDVVDVAADDGLGDDGDGDGVSTALDPAVAMSNVRFPSSMGLTFAVDRRLAGSLLVRVDAGKYERTEETAELASLPTRRKGKFAAAAKWKRLPIAHEVALSLDEAGFDRREVLEPGLTLFRRVRPTESAAIVSVTLALMNVHQASSGSGLRDELSFFQVSMAVTAPSATARAFVERVPSAPSADDVDLRSYRLLYRNSKTYAIGHGCATNWSMDDPLQGGEVRTEFVPRYDLRLAVSNPELDLRCQEMKFLGQGERATVVSELRQLTERYRTWIGSSAQATMEISPELRPIADDHIKACQVSCDRMAAGIDCLEIDDQSWTAFRLANQAMRRLRVRLNRQKLGEADAEPEGDESFGKEPSWFPFQLGFILLCLSGVADDQAPDRGIADLLWFPTGGGKTEAYLGLIAFTIFRRRLALGADGVGVTALMRYTLRLLTTQQFERASGLVCACELIRLERTDLGTQPISIGLWVGRQGTPNTRLEARRALDRLRSGSTLSGSNPIQLTKCPWCGRPLDHRNYYLTAAQDRLVIACKNRACIFQSGLPVFVVDEDLYDWHPTLIIATADKFASIAWREEAVALFNRDLSGCPPPELIVQDELHLISGPLGTLAGLYEAAIDALCTGNRGRPKVVASTATIRRAVSQGRSLFDREVRQFPSPGLDAGGSFFATEASPEAKGDRRYVGVMAPGSQPDDPARSHLRLTSAERLRIEG